MSCLTKADQIMSMLPAGYRRFRGPKDYVLWRLERKQVVADIIYTNEAVIFKYGRHGLRLLPAWHNSASVVIGIEYVLIISGDITAAVYIGIFI
jgi:hypothetical protein